MAFDETTDGITEDEQENNEEERGEDATDEPRLHAGFYLMRVLVIDTDACGLDFAYRCAVAGHEVKWFLRPPKPGIKLKDGKGFDGIERVDDWRTHMKWAKDGLVWVVHNSLYLKDLDQWKQFGFPVFAPSVKSAQLEINRGEGMKVLEDHGIPVPKYTTFPTLEAAEQAAHKGKNAFVFKTLGDEEDKSLTYVSDSPADMVETLRAWRSQGMKLKGPCMLQEKIDGVEMGVSGWMGPQGFLQNKWNHNFEFKKFMSGEFGPNTGEQGTVIQYAKESKLADQVLKPLEEYLRGLGHLGDIDVNCKIAKDGTPYVLEFTCRPGWPHSQIVQASHRGDPATWMAALLKGEDELEVNEDVAAGIVCTQPPYPNPVKDSEIDRLVGIPIYGLDEVWDQVHPWQMMSSQGCDWRDGKLVEGPIYRTTGEYVMVISGTGKNVRDAIGSCYKAIDGIHLKNMQVRNDVGASLEAALPKLHAQGYAPTMEF